MIALRPEPIDPAALLGAVGDAEHGGTALFLGTTRAEADRREVTAITYDVYEELSLREMERIAAECEARFGARVAVVHRLGTVPVGQASVACAASAGHRPAAFAACRYLIDELKRRVPIWKRVSYASGEGEWLDGRAGAPVASSAPPATGR